MADPGPPTATPAVSDVDPGWGAVGVAVWRARWSAMLGGIAGLALALVVVWILPGGYAATLLVGPVDALPRVSVPGGQVGDLSLLARREGAGDRDAAFGRYLARLTAPATLDPMLDDPALFRALFPGHARDGDRLRPIGVGPRLMTAWRRLLDRAETVPADGAEAARHLERRLSILSGADPRHRRVVLVHGDRDDGIALLAALDEAADAAEREAALERIAGQEAYLHRSLRDGDRLAARRSAVFGLIAEVEREKLRAEAGDRYAAMRISGPTAGSDPIRPRAGLLLAVGAITGVLSGLAITLIRRPSSPAAWPTPRS